MIRKFLMRLKRDILNEEFTPERSEIVDRIDQLEAEDASTEEDRGEVGGGTAGRPDEVAVPE